MDRDGSGDVDPEEWEAHFLDHLSGKHDGEFLATVGAVIQAGSSAKHRITEKEISDLESQLSPGSRGYELPAANLQPPPLQLESSSPQIEPQNNGMLSGLITTADKSPALPGALTVPVWASAGAQQQYRGEKQSQPQSGSSNSFESHEVSTLTQQTVSSQFLGVPPTMIPSMLRPPGALANNHRGVVQPLTEHLVQHPPLQQQKQSHTPSLNLPTADEVRQVISF